MIDVNMLVVIALGIAGALFSAVLGWLDSGEVFAARKFSSSMLRAFIAGVVSALGFQSLTTIGTWEFVFAFLGGAGIDVIGNRVSGAITAKTKEVKG